jgi:hypothetical protein
LNELLTGSSRLVDDGVFPHVVSLP